MRPTTYKSKLKNKTCVCKLCGQTFLAADSKTTRCPLCWEKALICECGAQKDKDSIYCHKCRQLKYSHTRGKTYEEIMGVEKAKIVRDQKIFKFKLSAKSTGIYRSLYEKDFGDFLTENNVVFQYEVCLQGLEKTWTKMVDFFLPQQKLYIELSGYIWAANREDNQIKFLSRILELASLLPDYQFIVASEPSLIPRIKRYFEGYTPAFNGKSILILSIYDLKQHIKGVP